MSRMLLPLILLAATAAAGASAEEERERGPRLEHGVAVLQGLDKVTARVEPITAPVGGAVRFGALEITVRACMETPPTEPPESAAFLEVQEHAPGEGIVDVFAGWMFASSPGLSAMEHPVYDVWVVDCEEPL